jgi:hypothetical protein
MSTTAGGHLASVHSQADQDLINDMVSESVWIGYHDRGDCDMQRAAAATTRAATTAQRLALASSGPMAPPTTT